MSFGGKNLCRWRASLIDWKSNGSRLCSSAEALNLVKLSARCCSADIFSQYRVTIRTKCFFTTIDVWGFGSLNDGKGPIRRASNSFGRNHNMTTRTDHFLTAIPMRPWHPGNDWRRLGVGVIGPRISVEHSHHEHRQPKDDTNGHDPGCGILARGKTYLHICSGCFRSVA